MVLPEKWLRIAAGVVILVIVGVARMGRGFGSQTRSVRPLTHGSLPLRAACRAAGVVFPPGSPRVEVRKGDRRLALYSAGVLVKEYRVALGSDPEPNKEREGDGRTPEGEFYVCTRLRQSRFHRFLGISYPGPAHARRALAGGRITRSQHRAILRAWGARRQPAWNTPLGGAVGIHGGGIAADWTLGCIALENSAVGELFPVLPVGTAVVIGP